MTYGGDLTFFIKENNQCIYNSTTTIMDNIKIIETSYYKGKMDLLQKLPPSSPPFSMFNLSICYIFRPLNNWKGEEEGKVPFLARLKILSMDCSHFYILLSLSLDVTEYFEKTLFYREKLNLESRYFAIPFIFFQKFVGMNLNRSRKQIRYTYKIIAYDNQNKTEHRFKYFMSK